MSVVYTVLPYCKINSYLLQNEGEVWGVSDGKELRQQEYHLFGQPCWQMEAKAQAQVVLLTSAKGNLLSTVLHCLQWINLSLDFTVLGQTCWAMAFILYFCSETQSCLPELVGREGSRKVMGQEESDQEGHFTDTLKWLGASSDHFPSSNCRMSYLCWACLT